MRLIKFLSVVMLCLCFSCSKPDKKLIPPPVKVVPKELFTSTQKYEIACWTIKKHEGFRQKAYKCSANKRTVGWGFTSVKRINNIHEADIIFKQIVTNLFKEVNKAYPDLSYLQKAAIVSLYYNTGSLVKIKNSKFSQQLTLKDIPKATVRFKKWCKVVINKKVITIKGLENRRTYEAKLLNNAFTMQDYIDLKKEVALIYLQNKA